MNKVYIYKDTFNDLLSLICFLIKNKIKPSNIQSTTYSGSLLEEIMELNIPRNWEFVRKLEKYDAYLFKILYYVFLSSNKYKELIIYYVLLNTIKYKHNVLRMRNLKCVSLALEISSYVSREAHKLKGFVRFKELSNNCLYARISPTNNVLEILAMHFKRRLLKEFWIIHDISRGLLCIYDKKNYYIVNEENVSLNLKSDNTKYEDLWCLFYDTIGIDERKNFRCRMNFMPKKYWQHIIEMRGNL